MGRVQAFEAVSLATLVTAHKRCLGLRLNEVPFTVSGRASFQIGIAVNFIAV